ncbi:MAG: GGDEF domain-containing protein [Candidatus Thiodiazotropha sp.]
MLIDQAKGSLSAADEIPDFLIKTTLGCSLVVILILIPFTINNFIQDRIIMGLATSSVAIACLVNVWHGFHGRYSLPVNTYLVSPTGTFTITYTLFKLAGPGSYWPFLLIPAYYFVLPEKRAWIFNALTVLITIPLAWSVLDQSSAIRFSAVTIGVSLFAFISMREVNILHGLLKAQAVTDTLTGLFNRSKLESFLRRAIAQNQRSEMPMALIIFDIDHFKSINDTLGHDKGDMVLQRLGELLGQRIRSSDMAFRVGGEEFLVLLHGTDEQQGGMVAEALRKEVEEADLLPDRRVTISAGVSELQQGMEMDVWMKACDEKLYRAKEAGRNRVVV